MLLERIEINLTMYTIGWLFITAALIALGIWFLYLYLNDKDKRKLMEK